MRRKISLYIGGELADLNDQTFILFNYTLSDLTNPTVMVNSYTQQITLPGTENNNRIFGHLFRPDRKTVASSSLSTGAYFDPISRTPFQIYDEAGEILEEGYVKLDKVDRTGIGPASYTVTLYGGLGSFLYGLTYDENGEKLSLADLDFFGTTAPDSELDFTISALNVSNAWDELAFSIENRIGVWSVLNFAPCYNGIPSNFAADKGLVTAGTTGNVPSSVYDNNGTEFFPDGSGYVVANLSASHTEWECKDLRCYLQRPVVSVKGVLDAIALPRNNGGYTVDLSAIDTSAEFAWQDLWMTLPLLPDLGTYRQESGNATLVADDTPVAAGLTLGTWDVQYGTTPPAGTVITSHFNVAPQMNCVEDAGTYYMEVSKTVSGVKYYHCSFAFLQIVAYDSNSNAVGASPVSILGSIPRSYGNDIESIATAAGFSPVYGGSEQYEDGRIISETAFTLQLGGYYQGPNLQMEVSCANVARYALYVFPYFFTRQENALSPAVYTEGNLSFQNSCLIPLWEDYDTPRQPSLARIAEISPGSYATYTSSTTVRSGVKFTKAMVLSGTCSPAEFLVSFCRMFGLYLDVNPTEKTVTVLRRNDFFQNTVEDLTKRIDRSSPISIRPVVVASKWYEFRQDSTGGEFADQYATVDGREYGIQRVNTGWAFDADTTDLLEGGVFRSCAAVLESGKCWYSFIDGGTTYFPPVFQDTGSTATFYDSGNTYAVDLGGIPATVTATPVNSNNPGYDLAGYSRAQFHDADGKPVDGSGVLLLYEGQPRIPYFQLTDDYPVMDTLVGGPCWLLDGGTSVGVKVPVFSRYEITSGAVSLSLDFGVPSELDIPALSYPSSVTVYAKNWKAYIGDLLNRDTKVMTCKVDLRGYQVGRDLLRRFWWYDGALWVLNKVTNHSLTTWDLTECEFVQVQDTDNYINGQV